MKPLKPLKLLIPHWKYTHYEQDVLDRSTYHAIYWQIRATHWIVRSSNSAAALLWGPRISASHIRTLSLTLFLCRFINNEWVKGVDGKTFETINPSTEEVICSVQEATEKDVDIAVAAARKAFEGPWKKVTPEDRGKMLVRLSELIEKNLDLLAAVESLDNGKSIAMAKGDVAAVAGCLRYYGGWADKIEGKVLDTNPDTFTYTRQEPVSLIPSHLQIWTNGSRLVCADRLSHGTSHCSCGHGRSVLPLPAVTSLS